jgi:phosphatidylglycerol:prolipoprotein diacylglycerol transferase
MERVWRRLGGVSPWAPALVSTGQILEDRRPMYQVLFTIPIFGGLKVFGFGVMLVVAFLSSTWLAAWRATEEHLDPDVIWDMTFWIFVFGLVGARLLYCVEYWGKDINSLWDVAQYWKGGIVYYGGIMGATVAVLVYRHYRPFPLRPYLDVITPSIAVGTLFGRLGCFLNGCCYGDTCDLPWAISFPKPSPPWWHHHQLAMIPSGAIRSLPVHPTQLYSAIDSLFLLLLLTAYFPLRKRDGQVMALLMMTYPISRFLIEYLRNDEGEFFAGLTISQNISVLLCLGGMLFWYSLSRRPEPLYRDTHPAIDVAKPTAAT